MKTLTKVFSTALLSLALTAGIGFTLTGCSADSLSGPDVETAVAGGGDHGGGGGTTGGGSAHNTYKAGGGDHGGGGGTTGGGSAHNTDG